MKRFLIAAAVAAATITTPALAADVEFRLASANPASMADSTSAIFRSRK